MTGRLLHVLLAATKVFTDSFALVRNQWDKDAESAVVEAFHEAKHSIWEAYRSEEDLDVQTLTTAMICFANQDETKPTIIPRESEAFQNVVSAIRHHLEGEYLFDAPPRSVKRLLHATAILIDLWENVEKGVASLPVFQLLHVLIERMARIAERYSGTTTEPLWDDAVACSLLLMVDMCRTANFETMSHVRHCIHRLFAISRRSFFGLTEQRTRFLVEALAQIRSLPWLLSPGVLTDTVEEFLENAKTLDAELVLEASISDSAGFASTFSPLRFPSPSIVNRAFLWEGWSDDLVQDQHRKKTGVDTAETAMVQSAAPSAASTAALAQPGIVNINEDTHDGARAEHPERLSLIGWFNYSETYELSTFAAQRI